MSEQPSLPVPATPPPASVPATDSVDKTAVQLLAVHEITRLMRWGFVCATTVIGLNIVVNGVVAVLTVEKPAWVEALSIVAALISGLFLPQAPLYHALKRFRIYISTHSQRTIQLEAAVDHERTSSGIGQDGTAKLD